MPKPQPPEPSSSSSEQSLKKIRHFVDHYLEKSGTFRHPDAGVTEAVVLGLARNIDEVGKPLCPCNFYPDKHAEAQKRTWICACEEMKRYKYCHCLLFVNAEGFPITEYLPAEHEGRHIYGDVKDPSPAKGREEMKVTHPQKKG